MSATPLVVYGTGGHARETADVLRDAQAAGAPHELLGFLTDDAGQLGAEVAGLPVLGGRAWLAASAADVGVVLAVGAPAVRRRVAALLEPLGRAFPVVRHPTALVSARATLGAGTMLAAGAIVTCDAVVGAFGILNRGANVSHDCRLGDFVTLAPAVQLSGNVVVGDGCDLGVGAVVVQGLTIGEWSVVGAGAAVTRSLPANCTAVGVPARPVKQRPPGWHLETS